MAQMFGLSAEQVARLRPFFPKEQGGAALPMGSEGILRRVSAPAADGPHKTLYSRCRRWSGKGVFDLILAELSASDAAEPSDSTEPDVLMIDATALKAHPMASSLNKGAPPA